MALSPQFRDQILANLPAYYRDLYNEGEVLDEDLEALAARVGIQPPEAPPSFEGVSSSVDSSAEEPQPAPSLLDRAGSAVSGSLDSLVGGFGREVGSAVFTDADRDGEGVRIANLLSPVTGPLQSVWQLLPESARLAAGQAIYQEGSEQAAEGREELVDNVPVLGGALSDVLANPSSAASLLGGPIGAAIGGSTAFNQSYTESRLGGLSEDDAMVRAGGNAALEGALSAIPAGQYLDRFLPDSMSDPLKDYLRGRVGNVLARTGQASVGEAAQESVTELAQIGWDKALSEFAPSEDLRNFSNQQLPKDVMELWERTKQAGAAGALGGTIFTAPTAVMQDMQQTGQLVGDLLNSYPERQSNPPLPSLDTPPSTQIDPSPQLDLFPQEEITQAPTPVVESGTVSTATQGDSAEQLSLLPEVGPELPTTAVERIQSVRSEIQKSREQAEKRRTKAAENARKKARSEFISQQVESTRDVDPEEADSLITRRTLEWEQQNPIENFYDLPSNNTRARKTTARTAPARTQEAPAPQEVPATQETPAREEAPAPSTVPGRTSSDQLDNLLAEAGFSSTANADNGTETTFSGREAIQEVIDNIGKGDARTAARILTNGSTRLVDDVSAIPEDSIDTRSGAYYHAPTGQTYIVASNLNRNQPVVGQILDRAAHEFKHAGDLGDNTDLRRGSLSTLIGVERNEEINNRIRQAAERNDPVARAALARLENSRETGARAELELPAYFIEESRKARRNSSVVNRIGRDILSAVRTGAKQILPGDYTVSIDDVAYLSDRLLQQAATSAQTNEATRENVRAAGINLAGLSSIQGPLSNRYQEAVDRGWTYTSMDGSEKFVTSDANSRINQTSLRAMSNYNDNEGLRVNTLLEHDELFSDYPPLADIPVIVDADPDGFEAGYYSATQTSPTFITIKKDLLKKAVRNSDYRDYVRGLILHELQHGIQDIEDTSRGGNDTMFRTPEDRRNVVRLKDDMLPRFRKARNEALEYALSDNSDIPEANVQMIVDTLSGYMDENLTMQEVTNSVQEELQLLPEGSRGRTVLQNVVDIFNEINPTRMQVVAMRKRTMRDYIDLLGEREANFTQQNRDLDLEQLPQNPEDPTQALGFAGQDFPDGRQYDGTATIREGDQFDGSQFTQAAFQQREPQGLSSVAEDSSALPEVPRQESGLSRATDVAWNTVRRALGPDGGVSNEIAEAVRAARNSQAAEALNSNILTNEFNLAIENARIGIQQTTGERLTSQELKDRILDDIEAINELPTREERDRAIDALDQKYPLASGHTGNSSHTLSKALRDIRRAKRNYTRAIIEARRANPKPLTKKEENVFRRMMENDERYTTRAYLATYDQEVGKMYGKRLLDRAYSDTNSQEYQIVNDAMNFIVNNDLLIPEIPDMMRMPIEKLRSMYESWGMGSAASLKDKRELAERLSERIGASREEMEQRAMLVIRDMLGQGPDETGARRRAVRVTRADTTITEGRTKIPAELRRLLGEITDPVMRETLTLHRMGNFVAKSNLMNELYTRGEGRFWSDTPSEKFRHRLADNEGYGPLAGKYIDEDMHYALSSVVKSEQELDITLGEAMRDPAAATELLTGASMRAMRGVVGAQKAAQVVMSPMNMALNLSGSPLMMMANGIFNPMTGLRGMGAAGTSLAADISLNLVGGDNAHKTATEMARVGALDTASVGMFQSDFFQEVQADLRAQVRRGENPSVFRTAWERARAGGRFTKDSLRNLYAFMDVWVKTATYLDRKNFWTRMNELEGMGLSDTEIQRRAGWDASTTNISYDRAIPLFRAIEQNSPFGMFLTYFSEAMIRVPLMNLVQAGRDAKLARSATNPEAKRLATGQAVRRATGTLLATAGVIGATLTALSAEDEEEKLRRNNDPEWYRYQIMIPYGTDAEGNPRYYSLNRVDPLGPLNEAAVSILMADEGEKLDAVWNVINDQFVFSKSIGATWQLLTDIAADATGNDAWDQKTQRTGLGEHLKTNFPDFYNTITQLDNDGDIPENLISLIDTFIPTGLRGARWNDWVFDPERNIAGFRPYVRDAEKSMRFRIYDHNNVVRSVRSDFLEYVDQRPNSAQLMAKMNSILDREERSFEDLHGSLQGYLVTPKDASDPNSRYFSRSEAGKVFRDERVGNLYRDVIKGRFSSSAINEKTLKRWYDNKLKEAKDKEERRQLREDYRMLREVYRDVMQERKSDD